MYSPSTAVSSKFPLGVQQYLMSTQTVLSIANRRNSKIWMDLAFDVNEASRLRTSVSSMMPQTVNKNTCCPYVPTFLRNVSPFTGAGNSPAVGTSCAFSFYEVGRGTLRNRICGNPDNHIETQNDIIRSYAGAIWQYDTLISNYCCDSQFKTANKEEIIFAHLQSFLDAMFLKIDQAFADALFAPVSVCEGNNAPKYHTFSDDVSDSADISGAALSLKAVQTALNSLLSTATARSYTYYWLVPMDIYAILAGFAGSSSTSRSVYPGMLKDGTVLRNALMLDMVSDVIVIGMDKSIFTEKDGSKIVTPLIPQGSIGFSWMKPSSFSLDAASSDVVDILPTYQSMTMDATGQNFPLPISLFYSEASRTVNLNNIITAMTVFVAGRLKTQYAPMFSVKVSNTPTAAVLSQSQANVDALTQALRQILARPNTGA